MASLAGANTGVSTDLTVVVRAKTGVLLASLIDEVALGDAVCEGFATVVVVTNRQANKEATTENPAAFFDNWVLMR